MSKFLVCVSVKLDKNFKALKNISSLKYIGDSSYGKLKFICWALPLRLSRKGERKIKIEKLIWKEEFENLRI